MLESQGKIGAFWSKQFSRENDSAREKWWQHPMIVRHINERVSGKQLDGLSAGLTSKAVDMAGGRLPFKKGVSVGCGTATLEIDLLCANVVQSFKVFDLSEYALHQGKELAGKKGVSERIEFILGNAFEIETEPESFDFIHWVDSLHHMLDTESSVRWSHKVLKPGGMFYMNEYVGPNRFQWTDYMLENASSVREMLPENYRLLRKANITPKRIIKHALSAMGVAGLDNRTLSRPNIHIMKHLDPSEAADSEKILDSVERYFPGATITKTGGVVYSLALTDILHNFDEKRDSQLLNGLLSIDDSFAEKGETLYATALAIKPKP